MCALGVRGFSSKPKTEVAYLGNFLFYTFGAALVASFFVAVVCLVLIAGIGETPGDLGKSVSACSQQWPPDCYDLWEARWLRREKF